MSTAQARPHRVRLGATALAGAATLGVAAAVAVGGALAVGVGAAGAAGPTSGSSGSTAAAPTLAGIKAKAAADITARVNALNGAITKVRAADGLGSGQSTLAAYLGADIAPLQQLNQTIQGETTVQQAAKDFSSVFSGYRVYLLVLPAAWLAADAFHATTTGIPRLTADATKAQGYVNAGNQAQLQPLLADLTSQIGAATSATNGVASDVLAVTPAQLNANRGRPVLPPVVGADRTPAALGKGLSDVQQIRTILKGSSTTAG